MDILQSIDTNVSSMVTSSFDEFISTKVKDAVEKEKEKFLEDLNMCEEEYPVFEPSNGLTEEDIELLKSCLELGWNSKMPNKEHPDFQYVLSHAKKKRGDGETFDENNFKEEYEKMYGKILSYYKTLTEYPHKIIDDNEFLIHFHGSKTLEGRQTSDSYGYGITNKGTVYQNIRKASPYSVVDRGNSERKTSSKDFELGIKTTVIQLSNVRQKYNMYPDTRDVDHTKIKQEVILLPNDKFKEERSRNPIQTSKKIHLYDISKYIKQSGSTNKCSPARDYGDGKYYEGTGCKCGQVLVKNVKKIDYEEEDSRNGNLKSKKELQKMTKGQRLRAKYPPIKKIQEEVTHTIEGDPKEDSIRRYFENDICPDCGSGELLYSIEDIGFNPKVINKYTLNKEYIDILHLIKPDSLEMVFGVQTIYAKYHPRANENYVIEEKIKKLTQIENVVEERVDAERKELEKEKENYGEKIKQVNEEKLKRIFSMFILRNERKENIKDKSTIREMIKHSNDKCKKKEQEQEIRLKTQQQELNSERIEFEKEKEQFCAEKEDYENTFKSKAKLLLDIANDINEINELQEDTTEKSEELFNLMKQLNGLK